MSNLAIRRQRKGLSQTELALVAGLNHSTLSRLENGGRPSHGTAGRLAKALGCTLADVWPGEALQGLILVDNAPRQ